MKLEPITLMEGGELEPVEDIEITITDFDGVWFATMDGSPYVYSAAHTKKDTLYGLYDQIAAMWKLYGLVDDNKLTKAARDIKYDMLDKFRYVG